MPDYDYKNLLELSPTAWLISQLIFDQNNAPLDLFLLDCNSEFEKLSGLQKEQLLNRRLNDTVPDILPDWINFCHEVYQSGKESTIKAFTSPLKKWLKLKMIPLNNNILMTFITDISTDKFLVERQKSITKALQESQDRFKTLAEVAIEGILIHKNGFIIDINKALCKMLGYTRDEVLGKNVLNIVVHPDDKITVLEHLKVKHTDPYEIKVIRKDGTVISVELLAYDMELNQDMVRVVSVRDLTEQKKNLDKIREIDLQFKTLFNNLPVGVAMIDKEFNILTANEKMLELFPYFNLDQSQKCFDNFTFCKTGKICDECALASTFTLRQVQSFERHLEINGNQYLYQIKTAPVFNSNGSVNYVIEMVEDITKRKEMEKAIYESEEKYRLLTEFSSDVTWILNLRQMKFTYISPSIYELRGYTVEEALAEALNDSLTPESFQYVQNRIKENIELFINEPDKLSYYIDEIQQKCKNGRFIWIETSTRFRYNENKEIEVIGVSRNIEARKQHEKQLLLAKEQSEAANQAKNDFLANISHEIRTPLNGIIGFSELLTKASDDPQINEYSAFIKDSGYALLKIINDIIDFSKMDSGKVEINLTRVNFDDIVTTVSDVLNAEISNKPIKCLIHTEPDLPKFIITDQIKLTRIILNLIDNSVKFTEEGEIEFKVSFDPINVTTGLFHFSVRDTGIGIDKKNIDTLFAPFIQGDTSTTRKYGGTGLGLTIACKLLKQLKSELNVLSEPGGGSEFFFTLETDYLNNLNSENYHIIKKNGGDLEETVKKRTDKSILTKRHFDKNKLLERINNDLVFFRQLLEISVEDINDSLIKLTKAIKTRDVELFRITAHSIKGIALNMCLDQMAVYTADCKSINALPDEKADQLYQLILSEWQELQKELMP